MQGQIDLFTLLTLVVAVIAAFQLRKVLGQRTGDEDERVERRKRAEEAREKEVANAAGKVVAMPARREVDEPVKEVDLERAAPTISDKIRDFAGSNASLAAGLLAINKADPAFDPGAFLKGAKHAYELIVMGFAEANRDDLAKLLNEEVFERFSNAITEREKAGERIDQSFVGISKADVLEAELVKGMASITVRFVSQLISATRNRRGDVIEGDPMAVKNVTDIWTFSRDVSTARARSNPNWKLEATEAPN